jgi:glucose-fructose oxidoreductase
MSVSAFGNGGRRLRLAGFCLDHMHLERLLATASADAFDIVGVHDPDGARMEQACAPLRIPVSDQFIDWEQLVNQRRPDVAVVCSTTAAHVTWCERLSQAGIHIVLEKPFAMSAAEAQRAARAAEKAGVLLAVNWPLAWYAPHRTTHRLIQSGAVGEILEVHYYGGNRGPQYHLRGGDRWEGSWWTRDAEGGGAFLDYLGYGATLATWLRNGEIPIAVTAARHIPLGSEVETQGMAIAEYERGLSSLQCRWGTFTDPWRVQPQPPCGFTVVGTRGTILSLDYASAVGLQTESKPEVEEIPVISEADGPQNIFEEMRRALDGGDGVREPCDPKTSLAGQQIVDAARESASSGRRVLLSAGA